MHRHKTGALIRASVQMGALSADVTDEPMVQRLDQYASAVGLCFQIVDDILDVIGDTEILGKTQGADIARNKPTYPSLLGLDGARQHAANMRDTALDHLDGLDPCFDTLRELAVYIVERTH